MTDSRFALIGLAVIALAFVAAHLALPSVQMILDPPIVLPGWPTW